MGSWISPNTFTRIPEPELDIPIVINGYKIEKPRRFKNKAHERAFEIALVLVQKKHIWSGVTIIDSSECIDIIMFQGMPEIQLNINAVNPQKVVLDAMKFVPSFFDDGIVVLKQRRKGKKIWFLEIIKK